MEVLLHLLFMVLPFLFFGLFVGVIAFVIISIATREPDSAWAELARRHRLTDTAHGLSGRLEDGRAVWVQTIWRRRSERGLTDPSRFGTRHDRSYVRVTVELRGRLSKGLRLEPESHFAVTRAVFGIEDARLGDPEFDGFFSIRELAAEAKAALVQTHAHKRLLAMREETDNFGIAGGCLWMDWPFRTALAQTLEDSFQATVAHAQALSEPMSDPSTIQAFRGGTSDERGGGG